MKVLIIGIDGGDSSILQRFNLPNLEYLFKTLCKVNLVEDLWSRGWSEFLSGCHGSDTGAFYTKPVIDQNGNLSFTQKFQSSDYYKVAEPLWDLIGRYSYLSGFLNFPTTYPISSNPPGFMVAGAGGGLSQKGTGGAPISACSSKNVKNILDQNRYIFDIRFRASGIRSFKTFIERLKLMQEIRTKSFLQLSSEYEVDIAAIAYMSISRLQNLAIYDILHVDQSKSRKVIDSLIKELYMSLDRCIGDLMESMKPEEVILLSDHGAVPRLGTLNINRFLSANGYLKDRPYLESKLRYYYRRHIGPIDFLPFDIKHSKAFSWRYINGIYINDRVRFGGPIYPDRIASIRDEIIQIFNSDETAKLWKLKAKIYTKNLESLIASDILPDIWIEKPDTLFCEGKGPFVGENHDYGPLGEDLDYIERDQFTGAKGRIPLFYCTKALASFISSEDDRNLTIGYKVLKRYLDNIGCKK